MADEQNSRRGLGAGGPHTPDVAAARREVRPDHIARPERLQFGLEQGRDRSFGPGDAWALHQKA